MSQRKSWKRKRPRTQTDSKDIEVKHLNKPEGLALENPQCAQIK